MRSEPEGVAARPEAMVEKQGDRTHALRAARGFSRGEISGAGIPLAEARFHGLRVDVRRRSKREENVAALKDWVTRASEAAKPRKPKKRRARAMKKPEEVAPSERPPKKKTRKPRAKPRKKAKKAAG